MNFLVIAGILLGVVYAVGWWKFGLRTYRQCREIIPDEDLMEILTAVFVGFLCGAVWWVWAMTRWCFGIRIKHKESRWVIAIPDHMRLGMPD